MLGKLDRFKPSIHGVLAESQCHCYAKYSYSLIHEVRGWYGMRRNIPYYAHINIDNQVIFFVCLKRQDIKSVLDYSLPSAAAD